MRATTPNRYEPLIDHVPLLRRLIDLLERSGAEAWEKTPRRLPAKSRLDPTRWLDTRDSARRARGGNVSWDLTLTAPPRSTLQGFFQDGSAIESADLTVTGAADLRQDLEGAGMILGGNDGRVRPMIRLVRIDGCWFLSDPARDLGSDAVYIGRDSVQLAEAARGIAAGRLLDAYAGSGVQGILAGRRADLVVISERNLRAVAMTRINAALNRAHATFTLQGDSLAGLGGRFDLILLNPPYGATAAADRRLAQSHAGGVRGDEETIRAMGQLPGRLTAGGACLIVGTFPCRNRRPLLFDERWTDLDLHFSAFALDPGHSIEERPYYAGIIRAQPGTGRRSIGSYPTSRRLAESVAMLMRKFL